MSIAAVTVTLYSTHQYQEIRYSQALQWEHAVPSKIEWLGGGICDMFS